MSEVEADSAAVEVEAAGEGAAETTTTVTAADLESAGSAAGSPVSVDMIGSAVVDGASTLSENDQPEADRTDIAPTSADASLTPEFSEPDANAEPPAEFVPASFVPAEVVPAEPAPDPEIFTEPLPETESEPETDAEPEPTSDEPVEPDTPVDQVTLARFDWTLPTFANTEPLPLGETAVESTVNLEAWLTTADGTTDGGTAPASAPAALPTPPEPAAPAKPAGPKLTPITQLKAKQTSIQRGRASVAPAPFRTDEELSQAQAATAPPAAYAGPAVEAPPSPMPAAFGREPAVASAPERSVSASPDPAASLATVTPPSGLPLVDAPAAPEPPADRVAEQQAPMPVPDIGVPETYDAVASEPAPAPAKPKSSLKPVAPAGFSARARVAPPDPNTIPLEPTPEELAAQAQAVAQAQAAADQAAREEAAREEAAREDAARAAADRADRQRAAREQAAREQAARDQAGREQAARDQAAREQAARDQAAREQAAREQAAREQAARDQAAREQAARDQAARDQAARDQAARDRAARNQAARDQAGQEQVARARAAREHAARTQAPAAAGERPAVRPTGAFPHYAPAAQPDTPDWPPAVPDETVDEPIDRRRRAGRLALVAGIVVLALIGGGVIGLKLLRGDPSKMAQVPSFAEPGAVLAETSTDAPVPTAAGLTAAVARPLLDSRLGTHVSFQVSDLATGKLLFGQNRFSPTTPASTMKLATASTLLALRGPNYRITTKVLAGAHPGEVVLVGGGDPTLSASNHPSYPEAAKLSDLAAQVKRALGGTKPTRVIVDSSLFTGPIAGPGWDPDDPKSDYATYIYALTTDGGRIDPSNTGDAPRYANTAQAAGQIFAKYLGVPTTAVTSGRAASGAAKLGSVQSPPLQRMLDTMLISSDNVIAEFMARQVAIASGKPASFSGAAAAVTAQLEKMGVPMQGVSINDGSGLSKNDRLTPAMLGGVFQYAANASHPELRGLFSGLPVAGWSGTLAGRFKTKATTGARGVFRAKTGTLTGVHALAGTVVDASGRTLVFVLLLDQVAWNANYAAAMDKLGAAVAACGCGS